MHQFDEVAKALAGGLSRREALRRLGVGAMGGLAALLGLGKARADPPGNCEGYCAQFYPPPRGKDSQNAFGQCVSQCNQCVHDGGIACGPTGRCCHGGAECLDDVYGNIFCSDCGDCFAACESNDDCCPWLLCAGGECFNPSCLG